MSKRREESNALQESVWALRRLVANQKNDDLQGVLTADLHQVFLCHWDAMSMEDSDDLVMEKMVARWEREIEFLSRIVKLFYPSVGIVRHHALDRVEVGLWRFLYDLFRFRERLPRYLGNMWRTRKALSESVLAFWKGCRDSDVRNQLQGCFVDFVRVHLPADLATMVSWGSLPFPIPSMLMDVLASVEEGIGPSWRAAWTCVSEEDVRARWAIYAPHKDLLPWTVPWSLPASSDPVEWARRVSWLSCPEWTAFLRGACTLSLVRWFTESPVEKVKEVFPALAALIKDDLWSVYLPVLRARVTDDSELSRVVSARTLPGDWESLIQDHHLSRCVEQNLSLPFRVHLCETSVWQWEVLPCSLSFLGSFGVESFLSIVKPHANMTWLGTEGWVRVRCGDLVLTAPPVVIEVWIRQREGRSWKDLPRGEEASRMLAGLPSSGEVRLTWSEFPSASGPQETGAWDCWIVRAIKRSPLRFSELLDRCPEALRRESLLAQRLASLKERGFIDEMPPGLFNYVP